MVLALQRVPQAAAGGDRTGTVQADVVEGAQHRGVAQHDDRLAAKVGGEVLAVVADIGRVADELPRAAEHTLLLERQDNGIGVEPRRNGGGAVDAQVEGKRQGHGVRLASAVSF